MLGWIVARQDSAIKVLAARIEVVPASADSFRGVDTSSMRWFRSAVVVSIAVAALAIDRVGAAGPAGPPGDDALGRLKAGNARFVSNPEDAARVDVARGVAYREGDRFDESKYARLVSRQFGTTHHTLYVEPERFQEFIPGYVWHMDEPVTEAAALSLYYLKVMACD